jgi:hypothetical protein
MSRTNQAKLTPADVLYILQSKEPNHVLAEQLGVTRQAISLVRNGKSYIHVAPELPRIPVRLKGSRADRNLTTCKNCIEWDGQECYFGFPEAIDEPTYATDCSLFRRNQHDP